LILLQNNNVLLRLFRYES